MDRSELNLEDILTDTVVEEDIMEVPLTDRIFRVFFGISVIAVAVVLTRVGYFTLVEGEIYRAQALANVSDVNTRPAPRGLILDRFGSEIVWNEPSFNVFLIPALLPEDAAGRVAAVERVGTLLSVDSGKILERLGARRWKITEKLFVAGNLSPEATIDIAATAIDGVLVEPAYRRVLASPFAFSHVVGYTGLVTEDDLGADPALVVEDQIGRAGIEASYDRYLRGVNGESVTFRDARGNPQKEQVRLEAVPGNAVRTFIDAELQQFVYQRLRQALASLGRTTGVVIVMNPQNGEVLSLVNAPSFDPNHIVGVLNEPTKPLFNRAVSGLYNPGSTIKPLVAIAALSEGVIDPLTQIFSAGFIEIPNPYFPDQPSRFLDWKPHGWVNVESAIARSSNVYFYEVGGGFEGQRGLGIERLLSWWKKFRLDSATGIDLIEERAGFVPNPAWKETRTGEPWRIGDTYNVSIGQGDLLTTPIRLVSYVSAIANGGRLVVPRVVDAVVDAAGVEAFRSRPGLESDLTPDLASALSYVREGMRDVVREPYGSAYGTLHDLPIEVSGKTGTAQIELNQKTNAFFIGFAPSSEPQIAVLVLVENSLEGSLNTLPVARDIFLWYYEHRMREAEHSAL